MTAQPDQPYRSPDKFDLILGNLSGLADVTSVGPSTVDTVLPMVGATQTFIVRTLRQREVGDTIFLQYVDAQGSVRIVIPPKAAEVIARQRDALTAKNRKKAARQSAAERKARGEVPAFLRGKGRRKGRQKSSNPAV